MIRCHLSRLMGERKMKIVDVARATGLHRNTVTLLYQESATRIDIEAIDKLCELFGCEVGQLLEFFPDAAEAGGNQ
ncbi:helix-turn-helix domain-containing protein [Solimonas sp. SE-A11]|uniref:helix-turn-helix domain-containing protein n=1 Tax=Solimonas sp. SE-A11 TaxID=3054954 RepID=UPI00345FA963